MKRVEEKIIHSASYGDVEDIDLRIDDKNFIHIFNILSNSLYSDKIGAVIRELICNARDANTEANSDRPIEIVTPKNFNNNFIVRDFGYGLSEDNIKKVFASVGESTKQNSNDSVGFFGIGSKSPFAYTDSYLIESVHNGYLNVYNNLKTERGPKIQKMGSPVKTDRPSGVKIIVQIKPDDINEFKEKLNSFLMFFDQSYILDNGSVVHPIKIGDTIIELKNIDVRLFTISCNRYSAGLLMGGVVYDIDLRKFGFNKSNNNTIISVPIGSVSVPPSREMIEYNDRNVSFIKNIIKEIDQYFNDYVDNITFGDVLKTKKEYEKYVNFCDIIGVEVREIETPYQYDIENTTRKVVDGETIIEKTKVKKNYDIKLYLYKYDYFEISYWSLKGSKLSHNTSFLRNIKNCYYIDTESNLKKRIRTRLEGVSNYICVINKDTLDELKYLDFPIPELKNISELPISNEKEKVKRVIGRYYLASLSPSSVYLNDIKDGDIEEDDVIYVVKCKTKNDPKSDYHNLCRNILKMGQKSRLVFCKHKFVDEFKQDFPNNKIIFIEDVKNKIKKALTELNIFFNGISTFIKKPHICYELYSPSLIKFLNSQHPEIKDAIREFSESKKIFRKFINYFEKEEVEILSEVYNIFQIRPPHIDPKKIKHFDDVEYKISDTLMREYGFRIYDMRGTINIVLNKKIEKQKILNNIHKLIS